MGHRVHQALEISVAISIKANFLRFLLGGERLQGARAVEATVRAVCGTWHEPVTPRAGVRTGAAARRPVTLLALLEMLPLDTSAGHVYLAEVKALIP